MKEFIQQTNFIFKNIFQILLKMEFQDKKELIIPQEDIDIIKATYRIYKVPVSFNRFLEIVKNLSLNTMKTPVSSAILLAKKIRHK